MKLVAEILTGTLFYVQVEENATVGDLKREIANQENLPRERLILMLDANQHSLMDIDDASLKEYGVRDGSHIYIFFEPLNNNNGLPTSPSTPQYFVSSESSPAYNIARGQTNEPSVSVDPSDQHDK